MLKYLFQKELCLSLQIEVKFCGKFKQQVHKVKYKPVQGIYVQHIYTYIYICMWVRLNFSTFQYTFFFVYLYI